MIQGNDSYRLIVRRGPQPNQSYDLNKDIITLGRDITNDIVINDPEVSRHHMRLTRGAGGFTLEDLGSTNGTFINGQRLTGARPLRPGDMIGLGETVTLAYEATAAAPGIGTEAPGGTMLSAAQRGASQPVMPQTSQPYVPLGTSQPIPPQTSPYAPPQGYPPPGVSQPMQPSQPVQPSGYTYGQPAYGSSGYTGQSSPYGGQSAPMPSQMPPTGGYGDIDPYAIRDDTQGGNTRVILIGCVLLSVICCCSGILGAVIVDATCSWASLPIIYPIIQAMGYVAVCP